MPPGGICDDLGGGGGAKYNGQPRIVDKFLKLYVAMYTVSTPRPIAKKSYAAWLLGCTSSRGK